MPSKPAPKMPSKMPAGDMKMPMPAKMPTDTKDPMSPAAMQAMCNEVMKK